MTESSSFQDLGGGTFRVSGARVSPTTGKYVISSESAPVKDWFDTLPLGTTFRAESDGIDRLWRLRALTAWCESENFGVTLDAIDQGTVREVTKPEVRA